MKVQQTVEQFIELRARGISFAKIAQQLVQTENHTDFGQFRTDTGQFRADSQPSPINSQQLWQRSPAPRSLLVLPRFPAMRLALGACRHARFPPCAFRPAQRPFGNVW